MKTKSLLFVSTLTCASLVGAVAIQVSLNNSFIENSMLAKATPSELSATFDDFKMDKLDDKNNFWSNNNANGNKIGIHIAGSAPFYQGTITLDSDLSNSINSNGVTANEAQRKYTFAGSTITAIQATYTGSGTLRVIFDEGYLDFSASGETINLDNKTFFTLVAWNDNVAISSIIVTYSC